MSRILLVGTVTLDLVFGLDHYPDADEEMRADTLRICRGGNAANSAVVLAALGHQPEFFGVLADAPETSVIENDFKGHQVEFSHCPRLPGRPPTSSIYLTGGHRSIVHYRDLPELSAGDFVPIDLAGFDWLHFEGRNVAQVSRMLAHARSVRPDLPVSIELEKPRDGMEQLFGCADLLICSRGFARHYGFGEPASFLHWMAKQAAATEVIVAWGEDGAYGIDGCGEVAHASAMPPGRVVDTLGAGDTFNAAVIDVKLKRATLPAALEEGCRVASRKCGLQGFDVVCKGG